MSRTLTALFDNRADAEAAKERLRAASIDISQVHVHDQTSASTTAGATSGQTGASYSTPQNKGFWAEVKGAFLPDEDRHTYEEGVRRGGAVLTAEVDENDADKAVKILEEANSIDLDQRAGEWRTGGWDYAGATAGAATAGAATGASAFGGFGDNRGEALATSGTAANEERIQLAEEELRIGKREVSRGGVRVRSYVVETPVSEEVRLRDEHVSVERRAVDLPVTGAEDAFRERTVEMTETAEEAVVAKDARVREELVIKKEAGERVEHVQDTVRRTEVEVENTGTGTTGLGGTAGRTGSL